MKKVFVVSKTHLDLGFTDYASVIRQTYIDSFIPGAVSLARQVNTPEKKQFIWTTGSWILKEALEHGTEEQKASLQAAIKRGDIVPHAMPFTMHTELLDADTLDYGLSIVDALDALRGRKTVAAKVTDVPGHTVGLVKQLSRHGIKLLHIGVNGASAVPEVPECFLWKQGGHEVVVIYSGGYGGAFQSGVIEEVLYLDHTLDNHGAPPPEKMRQKFKAVEAQYPGYEVTAGSLDDYAEILWEQRGKLPVLASEIGDTWIHGSASDPYKSAALRELMHLKAQWIEAGSMQKGSREYNGLSDALICIAEHTCGMDMKKFFADYEHYLKPDFQKARKADCVKMHHPLRDFPQNFLTVISRKGGGYKKGAYSAIEKSWAEQRAYIDAGLASLTPAHRAAAEQALRWLRPETPCHFSGSGDPFTVLQQGGWALQLNDKGGISLLSHNDEPIIRQNSKPVLEYRSYGKEDYDDWLSHYSRNLKQNIGWAVGDFGRPLLKYVSGKYPTGRFPYRVKQAVLSQEKGCPLSVCVDLGCETRLSEELGAPRLAQIVYTLTQTGLAMDVSWFQKDASRLTEALFLHLFPTPGVLHLQKLDCLIDPEDVVSKGGKNLHGVIGAELFTRTSRYTFSNRHAPILSPGKGKILEFDNKLEDWQQDGITYVLHNNVWGTNFPLWYEDNARFRFEITCSATELKDVGGKKNETL